MKGPTFVKKVAAVTVLAFCTLTMLYIYIEFCENFSKDLLTYLADMIFTWKFSKWHNSVKTVGGVTVLIFLQFADSALYL